MKGIIVKHDNELYIQLVHPTYGRLVIEPDNESRQLINESHILEEVDGCVIDFIDTEPKNDIKYNHWQFHIDSFAE